MIRTKFVCMVTVIDPDSQLPVELEIRKMETGPMVGIDASFLAQDIGPVYSPYDAPAIVGWKLRPSDLNKVELDIPDDEK